MDSGETPTFDLRLLQSEEELIQLIRTGTPQEREIAAEELLRRIWPRIRRATLTILTDPAAEDAAQIAAVHIYRWIESSGKVNSKTLDAWIFKVATNAARDVRRTITRIHEIPQDEDLVNNVPEKSSGLPFDYTLYNEVLKLVDALPLKLQVVIRRHLFAKDTVNEIAQDLGIGVAAVHARLDKARSILRKAITRKR